MRLGRIGVEERVDAGQERVRSSLLRREFERVAEFACEEFYELRGGKIALTLEVTDDWVRGGPAEKVERDIAVTHGGGAVTDSAKLFARLAITQGFGEPADGHAEIVDGGFRRGFGGTLHLR